VTTVAVPGPFDHDHDGPSGQLRGPDQPDYSLTNPCRGLLALQLALIVGEQVEPREIAGLIHDPPDADFLAPGSADSAPAQRHLARAFKALVLQDSTQAAAELDALAHSGDLPSAEASALRALLQRNVADFLRALGDLMSRHAKEAIKAHNGKVPDFYLSFAGLGLAALALRTGAVTQSLLPCDNVYLPLELLDMRRNGGTAGART